MRHVLGLTYAIINPNTGEKHFPPMGRHWRISKEKFDQALKDNRIVWSRNGKGRPQLKVFYEEKREFGSVDNSWFSADKVGTSTAGTKELIKLFGGQSVFDTPKPTSLLKKLITLANVHDGDIFLDFFSGSATSADAVMQFVQKENISLKYILVQLAEDLEEKNVAYKLGYKTICDIGEERIRRAGKKIKDETGADIDYGFRCFEVDSSNMKDVYYRPNEIDQRQLDLLSDNIKEDRSPEDLLIQVMLDLGILLSSKIETEKIGDKEVFSVADGYLLACFDKDVSEEVVTEIAKKKPYYAVFRDSGMVNDSVATNFEQIFETYSPETVRRVL